MFSFPVWHLCCHQNVVSNLVWYDTVSGKSLFYQLLKIELNIFSSSSHSQLFGKQTLNVGTKLIHIQETIHTTIRPGKNLFLD